MKQILIVFALVAVAQASISPVVKCTVRVGPTCMARWGYYNDGDLTFIPHGEMNGFSQPATFAPSDAPPVRFEPGRHETLFQTTWDCALGPIRWTINDDEPRFATALHIDTCPCGDGCLEGANVDASRDGSKVNYVTSGSVCDVSHFVVDLGNCALRANSGERVGGPCNPEFEHPYKIEGSSGNLSLEEPMTLLLGDIMLKGGEECSICEALVPVCSIDSTSVSESPVTSSSSVTSTTSTSVVSTSITSSTSTSITSSTSTSTSVTSSTSTSITSSTSTSTSVTSSTSTSVTSSTSVSSSVTSSTSTSTSSSAVELTSAQATKPAKAPPRPKPRRRKPVPVEPPKLEDDIEDPPTPKAAEEVAPTISTGGWVFIGIAAGAGVLTVLGMVLFLLFVVARRRKMR